MTVTDALKGMYRLFLDTSPVIFHVEGVAAYRALMDEVFLQLRHGSFEAITSPITLAECLVHPYRHQDMVLVQQFIHVVTQGLNTRYVSVESTAQSATELRARYNLSLTDAFQIAVALAAGCDAFLTNDIALKRVTEIPVLVLDELDTSQPIS